MLVLSRKCGERVVIGPNVFVAVVEIRGDRVKLAFSAPGEVPIHREEVHWRIVAEQEVEERKLQERSEGESVYYSEFA